MSRMLHPFLPAPTIAIHFHQDEQKLKSVTNNHLVGHIILDFKAPIDISQISVSLSGHSISRLDGTAHSQSHQFFETSRQVFPQDASPDGVGGFTSRTMGTKEYAFPFSLPLLQCPRSDQICRDEKFQTEVPGLMAFNENLNESFRCQLPHSTGNSTSNAEILYLLEARVTLGGIFRHVMKKSRQIPFYPNTISSHRPSQSIIHQREIAFNDNQRHQKSAYGVAIELGRGGHLALGQRVPIEVHVTQADLLSNEDLMLNDYQVMLIQKTISRVGAQSQVHHLFRTPRTVSNLNLPICLVEMPINNAMTISDSSLGPLFLPTDITPTFETCNITRTYKIEVRLGFRGGRKQMQTRILEVQFPIETTMAS